MRRLSLILVLCLTAAAVFGHDSAAVRALEKRVVALEERIEKLDHATAPAVAKVSAEERADGQRMKARERMRKDSALYSSEKLREIETLYQVANKKWRSQEGKDSLKRLIEKYDKANRTGCALLYLGQMSKGEEKEQYLQKAIDGYSDCFYGNGVQVGAYARFYMAYHCKETGRADKAAELFKVITTEYPDAINHRGKFLADLIGE